MRDAPVPVDALWNPAMQRVDLTFSHPILSAPLDNGNWSVRFLNLNRPILSADVTLPGLIDIRTVGAIADPGPDGVSFSPPPFDVVSDTLRPFRAEAFADFPLHT